MREGRGAKNSTSSILCNFGELSTYYCIQSLPAVSLTRIISENLSRLITADEQRRFAYEISDGSDFMTITGGTIRAWQRPQNDFVSNTTCKDVVGLTETKTRPFTITSYIFNYGESWKVFVNCVWISDKSTNVYFITN